MSEAAHALPPRLHRAASTGGRAGAWLLSLRPAYVLVPLAVVQWLALVAFALTVRHNGWLFYQGGDQTFYYSAAWSIAHGHLPTTAIGYAWPIALAPVALFAGKNVLSAMPAIVLVQAIVLLPAMLVGIYALACRIGGRALGYLAAAGWVVAPYLVIPGFVHRFHPQYVEQFLPQALGLTGLSDFVSTGILIASAYFFFRTLDEGGDVEAALAGLLAGLAVGIKPANAPFLAGPALAILVARRWRGGAAFAAAMLPALLTLALWKERGLGHIPLIADGSVRLAAGAGSLAPAVGLPHYIQVDWGHLGRNLGADGFREYFWSERLVEWLPFGGIVAVARASIPKALFLGGWLAAFVVVKGASPQANVEDGSFFRLLMPAWPAYLLLVVALPLLVPGVARALARHVPKAPVAPWRSRGVLASFGVLALVPLVLVLALPLRKDHQIVTDFDYNTVVPVSSAFQLRATRTDGGVRLTWKAPAHGSSRVFYRVFRAPVRWVPTPTLTPAVDGVACIPDTGGAAACRIEAPLLTGPTRDTTLLDPVTSGRWSYRVGLLANWRDDPTQGDVLLLSEPARVSFGGG